MKTKGVIMKTKSFSVQKKYYDDNGIMIAIEYNLTYTHEDSVTTSRGGGVFVFNPDVMSLPLPTKSSSDSEIELAMRDSNGDYELDAVNEFHDEILNQQAFLNSLTVDDECCESCIRAKRNAKLVETDWWAFSDLVMTEEQIAYRQALRDVPSQVSFPEEVIWPTKPE